MQIYSRRQKVEAIVARISAIYPVLNALAVAISVTPPSWRFLYRQDGGVT
ncbi:hypothetical protein [Kamptonema sp. UHCC 0994]|nr:hypothetical protein [Kamptonema sp. UHCC 0994]MDF0551836.1 hypothetical protein [Kamptonema sp. UHCC 0994]